MVRNDTLGSFEQLVMLALVRLGEQAYGMTVRQEIERRAERAVALGAVYATLERLERKGLVKSHTAAGGAERGGRARRFFRVQASGKKVLRQTLDAVDRMRTELPGLAADATGAGA